MYRYGPQGRGVLRRKMEASCLLPLRVGGWGHVHSPETRVCSLQHVVRVVVSNNIGCVVSDILHEGWQPSCVVVTQLALVPFHHPDALSKSVAVLLCAATNVAMLSFDCLAWIHIF